MEDSLQSAFMLMVVGMITVFVILFLVVLCSKLLIAIVNHFFPAATILHTTIQTNAKPLHDNKKISVIIAAVETVISGTAHITEINKIDNQQNDK